MKRILLLTFLSICFISLVSAELEIGTAETSGIIFESNEQTTNGGNSSFNETLADATYWRLDGTNAPPTADWDMGGVFGLLNVGNSEFVGSVVFRVGTVWRNLLSQDSLTIDCSNSYCRFLTGQPVRWGSDPDNNPDMTFDNQSGQFTYNRPVNITQGINMNAGSHIDFYSPSAAEAAQLNSQNGYTLFYALNNLVVTSDADIGINSEGISTTNASVLFTSNKGISTVLNGTTGQTFFYQNVSINNRFNVSEGGAVRATTLVTSGLVTANGGLTVGTSVTPSGSVSIGNGAQLFVDAFLSRALSDGSNPVTVANIGKKTTVNTWNATNTFTGNVIMSGTQTNITNIVIVNSANYVNASGRLAVGMSTTTAITRGDGVICNMTWIDGGRVNSTFGDCG